MFTEEWPLMMFTLLVQLGVGSFIVLTVIKALLAKENQELADRVTKRGLIAVGLIVGLGLLLSLFHLGTPSGAYRAVLNFGSSWLSREIVLSAGFFVFWAVAVLALYKGKEKVISWITGLIGLVAVFAMAGAYTSSVKPAWEDINTYLVFYGTTIVYGVAGAAAAVACSLRSKAMGKEVQVLLKKVSWVGVAAVVIPLIYLPFYISGLNGGGEAAQASGQLLAGDYLVHVILQYVLSAGGLVVALYSLYKGRKEQRMALPLSLTLILILAGGFLGRYVFYATAVAIMVG